MRTSVVALAALAAVAAAADGRADGPVELDRLRREAAEAPPAELEARLASPVREVRLAAIAAASAAPDPIELLDELAEAAGGWDRSVAAPAARAAGAIARSAVGGQGAPGIGDRLAPGEPAELDDDEVGVALEAWRALAVRPDRWPDIRVQALEVVVALTGWRRQTGGDPAPAYDVAALVRDADPEVRRAALELIPVPAPIEVRPLLVRRLVDDPAPVVRLAAAQALCADLPREAAAVLTALGPDGLAALRAAAAPPLPSGAAPAIAPPGAAALDAARCLAADADPASQRALEQLRHRLPRPLRATLAVVIADVTARAPRPR